MVVKHVNTGCERNKRRDVESCSPLLSDCVLVSVCLCVSFFMNQTNRDKTSRLSVVLFLTQFSPLGSELLLMDSYKNEPQYFRCAIKWLLV